MRNKIELSVILCLSKEDSNKLRCLTLTWKWRLYSFCVHEKEEWGGSTLSDRKDGETWSATVLDMTPGWCRRCRDVMVMSSIIPGFLDTVHIPKPKSTPVPFSSSNSPVRPWCGRFPWDNGGHLWGLPPPLSDIVSDSSILSSPFWTHPVRPSKIRSGQDIKSNAMQHYECVASWLLLKQICIDR